MSCSAIYGPFLVMAIYALLFVDCTHCKQTAWQLLPYGPGVVAVEMGRQLVDLPRPDGIREVAVPIVAAAGMVAGLTGLTHIGGRWWKALVLTAAFAACSLFAFGLLAAIRA
jgi:hypothetical protein